MRLIPGSPWWKFRCIRRAMHPAARRYSSLEYSGYSPSSRLDRRAPRPSRCDAALPPRAAGAVVALALALGAAILLTTAPVVSAQAPPVAPPPVPAQGPTSVPAVLPAPGRGLTLA